MKQKAMSIYEFKKGDIITRIEPSKPIPGLDMEDLRDRAYIGVSMKFLGVANGCVYVERYDKNGSDFDEMPEIGRFFKAMMGGGTGPINLPIDMWDEGWSYYIDPYEISNDKDKKIAKEILDGANKIQLKKELKEALEEEDYEKAEEIKKILKKYE
jgi:hypothetical protein